MRSITNANFRCKAARGGWSREARIENHCSLAEVEAISDTERSTHELVLKNAVQEPVAFLASKKRSRCGWPAYTMRFSISKHKLLEGLSTVQNVVSIGRQIQR